MPQTRGNYEFFQEASLSQKLAWKFKEYEDYAGSDPEISQSIALLNVLHNEKKINLDDPGWKFVKALLNEQRKAAFATSDKVNEISKMGMQLRKREHDYYGSASNNDSGEAEEP